MISRFRIVGEEPEQKELQLPDTLEQYAELFRETEAIRAKSTADWKAWVRLWSAGDLFFLVNYLLSTADVRDPYQGDRPFFFNQEHLDYARAVQFDSNGTVDICARGFGKSTFKTFALNLQTKLQDPNRASVIFSHNLEAAQAHLGRLIQECRTNTVLKFVWDDRLWWDPDAECPKFGLNGVVFKRTTSRQEMTFEARTFVRKLPTGAHYDERFYDDIEEEEAVQSEAMAENLELMFISSQDLSSQQRWATVTGTYYAPSGLMRKLHTSMGWKLRLLPGEDVKTKPENPDEAGPLGGTPRFFTKRNLFDIIQGKGGIASPKARRSYAMQIACEPVYGEANRLSRDLFRYYDEDPLELAASGNLYITADTSKGAVDPTWAWVWRLGHDRTVSWVGGFRARLPPSKRKERLYQLINQFATLGELVQCRFESFGASEVVENQIEYNQERGLDVEIISCHDNSLGKIERAFERWEPRLRERKILIPRALFCEDESGDSFDMVAYFLDHEIDLFPKPDTDDGLDGGGLLWESEAKVGPLVWPVRKRVDQPRHEETGSYMSQGVY